VCKRGKSTRSDRPILSVIARNEAISVAESIVSVVASFLAMTKVLEKTRSPSPDRSGNPFLRFFTEKKIETDSRK
jgi:hypothetical protein